MSFPGDHAGGSYLRAYLSPLDEFLSRTDVTDIYINEPGIVWVETVSQGPVRMVVPALDGKTLHRMAQQIAAWSSKALGRHSPMLAASLPTGERVQVIVPPATRKHIAIAIRKQTIRHITLDDYAASGLFETTVIGPALERQPEDTDLHALLAQNDISGFLRQAVLNRKNIIISGGTATGKTTFLNTLLQQIPVEERLVLIEDTPEVQLSHPNAVGLLSSSNGDANTTDGLLQASLRMRPSRIILGELRGPEAYSFLRAINTGHPGSVTTLHADSPRGAIEQLALMVLQSGTTLSRADVIAYVRATVDVIVQLSNRNGRRGVSQVNFGTAADRLR